MLTPSFFKRSVFLFVLFILAGKISAQNPTVVWANHCGNSASDKTMDISMDASGNIYTCGYFNHDANFGSIYLNPGTWSKDAFIARIDPANGNYLWAVEGGDDFDDRALGLCNDPQGNVIVTGTYWNDAVFAPDTLSGSADHIFVVKIDPSGNVLWAVTGGSDGDDHGYDLVTDPQGNIFLTGYLSNHYANGNGTAVFGTLPTFLVTDSIAFVARLSSSGQWQWIKTFGGTDVQRDNDIALDSLGNVYVCGGFYGTKTFGTQTITSVNNSRDIFVVKYDAAGNFQWVTTTGDSLDDRANGMTADDRGHLYITGEFRDHVIFGNDTLDNHGGPGGKDIFVAKMDMAGNWIWARLAGSTKGGESGRGVATNSQGNIFVTGECNGNVHFGSDTILHTGADSIQVFVAGIDSTGGWRWAMQMGSPLEDRGYALVTNEGCELFVCGYHDSIVGNFGSFALTTYGRKDGFTVRIDGGCFGYSPAGISSSSNEDCMIRIPQFISPDGDGVNDVISIQQEGCLRKGEWKIYNALGQPVFSSADINAGWNGRGTNDQALASGIYFYRFEGELQSGEKIFRSGSISLVK